MAETLEARRGGRSLFAGLSFALGEGEALLVRGPNGSGKSTLLRIAAGLLPAASGRVRLEGAPAGAAVHYLSTQNAMKPALSVTENLLFWRDFLAGAHDKENPPAGLPAGEALEAVGLAHAATLPFGVLSTGQQRRAALARLLLVHRPLWLLDEPASGLDEASARRFSRLMAEHLGRGGMVLAAVHEDPGLAGAREIRLGRAAGEGEAWAR